MLRLVSDEDFRGPVISGLRLRHPELDLVRAVEVGLGGHDDDLVLAWAASVGRVTVSHDVNTMIDAANRRLDAGEPMSGLIVVPQRLGIGRGYCRVAAGCRARDRPGNEWCNDLVAAVSAARHCQPARFT